MGIGQISITIVERQASRSAEFAVSNIQCQEGLFLGKPLRPTGSDVLKFAINQRRIGEIQRTVTDTTAEQAKEERTTYENSTSA